RDCNCQRYYGRDCRKCFNPPYPAAQPMQQGGGEVCETCDGAGHVVTYADPYDRGDVSSPEQSPCPACTTPPSAPVGVSPSKWAPPYPNAATDPFNQVPGMNRPTKTMT